MSLRYGGWSTLRFTRFSYPPTRTRRTAHCTPVRRLSRERSRDALCLTFRVLCAWCSCPCQHPRTEYSNRRPKPLLRPPSCLHKQYKKKIIKKIQKRWIHLSSIIKKKLIKTKHDSIFFFFFILQHEKFRECHFFALGAVDFQFCSGFWIINRERIKMTGFDFI